MKVSPTDFPNWQKAITSALYNDEKQLILKDGDYRIWGDIEMPFLELFDIRAINPGKAVCSRVNALNWGTVKLSGLYFLNAYGASIHNCVGLDIVDCRFQDVITEGMNVLRFTDSSACRVARCQILRTVPIEYSDRSAILFRSKDRFCPSCEVVETMIANYADCIQTGQNGQGGELEVRKCTLMTTKEFYNWDGTSRTENGVDLKGWHCFIEGNCFYGFRQTGQGASGSGGSAIVLQGNAHKARIEKNTISNCCGGVFVFKNIQDAVICKNHFSNILEMEHNHTGTAVLDRGIRTKIYSNSFMAVPKSIDTLTLDSSFGNFYI